MEDFWVFGYGSLMWRPGFDFEEAFVAALDGYHRSLCVYSYHYRGTEAQPGLVLGLDEGGSAMGMAFRVKGETKDAVLKYLRSREQVTMVYREQMTPVRLLGGPEEGAQVEAVTYVADRSHQQYAGRLSLEEQMAVVRKGHGLAGPNIDYVLNTVDHLVEIDIEDADLFALAEQLRANSE